MRLGNNTPHEILTDNFRVPRKSFMVFWERRRSGGNEHSGLHGCEWSTACDDDIEAEISCSLTRKSGFATFSTDYAKRGSPAGLPLLTVL